MTTPYGSNPWQPPPDGWAAPTPPQSQDALAISSCVLGVLAVLTLPVVAAVLTWTLLAAFAGVVVPAVAVVTGHLAHRRSGSGLALTGLICGYGALALVLLLAVVRPSFSGEMHVYTSEAGPRPEAPTLPDEPLQEPPTARGILTGTVTGLDDEPVAGATVTVRRATPGDVSDHPPCPITATATTGPDGLWLLPLCQLGDGLGWSVAIRSGRLGAGTELAYVHSGRTTTYDVRLAQLS